MDKGGTEEVVLRGLCLLLLLCCSGCVRSYKLMGLADDAATDGDRGGQEAGPSDGPVDAPTRDGSIARDAASRDRESTDGLRPLDGGNPIASAAFDFASRSLAGWTTTAGSWTANSRYLEGTTGQSQNNIEVAVAVDGTRGTLQMDVQLPALDCREASMRLLDATKAIVLSFGLNYCVPWGGTSNYALDVSGYGSSRPAWTADTAWHTLAVKFNNGSYQLYDGANLVATLSGPARLRASYLQFGGWQHTTSGTRYDNIVLGP